MNDRTSEYYPDTDPDQVSGPQPQVARTAEPPGAAPAPGPPFADCVQCGEPTEYGTDHPGAVLCPVCAWQEAERVACSG